MLPYREKPLLSGSGLFSRFDCVPVGTFRENRANILLKKCFRIRSRKKMLRCVKMMYEMFNITVYAEVSSTYLDFESFKFYFIFKFKPWNENNMNTDKPYFCIWAINMPSPVYRVTHIFAETSGIFNLLWEELAILKSHFSVFISRHTAMLKQSLMIRR